MEEGRDRVIAEGTQGGREREREREREKGSDREGEERKEN